jgi:hypothetical protein
MEVGLSSRFAERPKAFWKSERTARTRRGEQAVTRPTKELEQMSSARRMEKSAYRFRFCELVVKRYGFFGRQHVRSDLAFLQKIERLAWYVKALGHSARKHDHCCAVIQQFLHVGDLDSGIVAGPSLAPIPIT